MLRPDLRRTTLNETFRHQTSKSKINKYKKCQLRLKIDEKQKVSNQLRQRNQLQND